MSKGKNHLRTKVFLTVGDFNLFAYRFYSGRGYTGLGKFENLFHRGITETLLVKKWLLFNEKVICTSL